MSPFLSKRLFIESTLSCGPCLHSTSWYKEFTIVPSTSLLETDSLGGSGQSNKKEREKGRAEKRGMEEAGLGLVLITPAFINLAQRGVGSLGMSALGHCDSIASRLYHCTLGQNMLNIHFTHSYLT